MVYSPACWERPGETWPVASLVQVMVVATGNPVTESDTRPRINPCVVCAANGVSRETREMVNKHRKRISIYHVPV